MVCLLATSKLVRIASLVGLAAATVTAYIAFQRATVNVQVRDANEAIQAAITRSQTAVAKSRALRELITEEKVRTNRAAIVAAAREASDESLQVARLYLIAQGKANAAADHADSAVGAKYWRLKRDSLASLAEAAEASATGYSAWEDSTNPDLKTIRKRQSEFADLAEAARAKADHSNAEAEKLAAKNRGEF